MNDNIERHPDVVASRTEDGVPILKSFKDTMILKGRIDDLKNQYGGDQGAKEGPDLRAYSDFDEEDEAAYNEMKDDVQGTRDLLNEVDTDMAGIKGNMDKSPEEKYKDISSLADYRDDVQYGDVDLNRFADYGTPPSRDVYDGDIDEFGFSSRKSAKPIKNLIGERRKNWSTCIDALHEENGSNSGSKATAGDWVSQDEAKAVSSTNTPPSMNPIKKSSDIPSLRDMM